MTATTGAQPWELQAHVEDVADSASPARWTVEERAWKDLVPALPDEVIALIAPSVVVCAEGCPPTAPVVAAAVPAVPATVAPGVPAVAAGVPAAGPAAAPVAEPRPRLLTPALPRRVRRRTAG